jgi:hypothetical protein
MDNLAALFSAAALIAVLALLIWGVAGGWRRLLGDEAALVEAVKSCASCAARPVCETGALAGWLGRHPANCPNVHRLRPTP